jgi:hypothetical protein
VIAVAGIHALVSEHVVGRLTDEAEIDVRRRGAAKT